MDLLLRGNTDDHLVAEHMNDYRLLQLKDRTVLDLGANIGAFARHAYAQGAKKIICYEPDPDNFKMLTLNTADIPVVELHEFAVTGTDEPTRIINKRKSQTLSSSLFKFRQANETKLINAIRFDKVITHDVDAIKMDIEGSEYECLNLCPIPDHVKQIIVEFHHKQEFMIEQFQPTIDLLNSTWTCIQSPKRNNKTGFWIR